MNSIVWISVMSTIILKARSDTYERYYAENDCSRFRSSTVEYRLAPSGHASSAIIKATRHLSYSYPFDCNITVTVRNSRDAHVLLSVQKISFPYKSNCNNYVKIYQGNVGYQLCSKIDISGKTVYTRPDSNNMKFLYHTEVFNGGKHTSDDFFNTGFEILATAYTFSPCGKDLSFRCDNGRCISRKLVRDSYDNCGDGSDESRFTIRFRLSTKAIAGIITGILLLIAGVSCAVWIIRRKRVVTTRTYTTPVQPLYPTGPLPYPQAPVQYTPFPSAPGAQNQYGGEVYQKSGESSNQYRGVTNPTYGQPPPPPYQ